MGNSHTKYSISKYFPVYNTYLKTFSLFIILFTIGINGIAQEKLVYGRVFAFKELKLNNIEISAKKAKTTVTTDSLGRFKINCKTNDKLEFTGNGFNKLSYKLDPVQTGILNFKMIFKGGEKNFNLAVESGHVSKENLEFSIKNHPHLNYEYFTYANIYEAIDKIWASDLHVRVRGRSVFVRKEKTTFSSTPAIFIVNGKLDLDVSDILTSNIESIEIIPDGSDQFGPNASHGVVFVKTIK